MMVMLGWTEKFSVGVRLMDNQHKNMLRLFNYLYNADQTGKDYAVLGKVLDGVVSYTESHFKAEEEMMDQYNYNEYALHKSQHNELIAKVKILRGKYYSG